MPNPIFATNQPKDPLGWKALTTTFNNFFESTFVNDTNPNFKPGALNDTIVGAAKDFGKPMNPLEFMTNLNKAQIGVITGPFQTTAGLLKDFGKDVIGQLGGMTDKMAQRNQQYGVGVNLPLSAAEGALKGTAVAAAGAMAGKGYQMWDAAGKPMGGYVESIQKQHLQDPNTSLDQLLQDHKDYHKQLGTSGEEPLSKYHEDLSKRIAAEKGLPDPVLAQDYGNLYLDQNIPGPADKGPFRATDTPINTAEKEAAYRWTQKRTFNIDDQWDTYKTGVIKDLRRLGVDDNGIQMVKDLPRGSATRDNFASYLYKSADLPATAKPILRAWQDETTNAYVQFQHLSRGDAFTRAEDAISPVDKMNKSIFLSNRSANGGVADILNETANLYDKLGDSARAGAYRRASDLITTKGVPNVVNLTGKGGAGAILEAFKGQGGIGNSMAQHIKDIVSNGSFPELDALRIQTMPQVPDASSFLTPGRGKSLDELKPSFLDYKVKPRH